MISYCFDIIQIDIIGFIQILYKQQTLYDISANKTKNNIFFKLLPNYVYASPINQELLF